MGEEVVRYAAAGGVVVGNNCVLVLDRPSRDEIRLPKGHVEPGEDLRSTALREVCEESGHADLSVEADLGAQIVEFDYQGQHYLRTEHYFLMALENGAAGGRGRHPEPPDQGDQGLVEGQFRPRWLPWDEALATLTFEAEREWVRRARRVSEKVRG